jgi:hypothetical protein
MAPRSIRHSPTELDDGVTAIGFTRRYAMSRMQTIGRGAVLGLVLLGTGVGMRSQPADAYGIILD